MKTAFKAAIPTLIAVILGYIAIEAIKYGRAKFKEEQDFRKQRAMQAQALNAQSAPEADSE